MRKRAPSLAKVHKDLGRQIAAARKSVGLTQEELAHRTGIDVKRIQRLEAGLTNPTVRTLVLLSAVLKAELWTWFKPA